MTIAVIGATGHVGSEIVRGAIARGVAVAALVRDADEGRRTFGEPDGLHLRPTRLDDPRDVTEALEGIRNVFIAMGSVGVQGVLQRKFGEGDGPLPDEEIAAVLRDETEELQDAPVQAFTSLIAENNARNRVQELADEADRGH